MVLWAGDRRRGGHVSGGVWISARRTSWRPSGCFSRRSLFQVLESLDGLSDDADVAFLLTTNRVDILEPALAQRPGRIDLAVEVPLPDLDARRRLIALYARELLFSGSALEDAATRTAGTTASFAKELVRRSVLIAADAGRDTTEIDLDEALDEMLSEKETITRSLLGSSDPHADQ